MKKYLFIIVLGIMLTGQFNAAPAAVIFSDDFNVDGLDNSKWSAVVDSGCSLDVSGGIMHNYFDGAGATRGSFARSVNISLPANWSSVTITGQWAFPVIISGELLMSVNNADAPDNLDSVAYYSWEGPGFRIQDSDLGTSYVAPRSIPQTLTDFEWVITPTGWQFNEYRDGSWTPLVDRDTTNLAGMSQIYLVIGGWEYSNYGFLQQTNYDNIVVSVVPEPATMALLSLGGLLLGRNRKFNKKQK